MSYPHNATTEVLYTTLRATGHLVKFRRFVITNKVSLFRKPKLVLGLGYVKEFGLRRVRIKIRNNKPYALFGIMNLRNNEPSE